MAIIAVAGGSGDVGRTIVEELVRNQNHRVYVLTRKAKASTDSLSADSNSHAIIPIDYALVSEIRDVLRHHDIDTVISALNLQWPGSADSQINLIRAAAQSGSVTRFIPSEFNIDYHSPAEQMPYPFRDLFLQAEEELRRHQHLQFTLVRNGFFMDYLGLPSAETNLHPLYAVLDLEAGRAVLPGDGTDTVVFTHTRDVAKYVSKLLDTPGELWPRESAIIGQRIVLKDLVSLAESITGRQFEISYDALEKLKCGETTELPSNKLCYGYFPEGKQELNSIICTMMIGMVFGVFDIKGTNLGEMFPDVEPLLMEPFLRECWAKRS